MSFNNNIVTGAVWQNDKTKQKVIVIFEANEEMEVVFAKKINGRVSLYTSDADAFCMFHSFTGAKLTIRFEDKEFFFESNGTDTDKHSLLSAL